MFSFFDWSFCCTSIFLSSLFLNLVFQWAHSTYVLFSVLFDASSLFFFLSFFSRSSQFLLHLLSHLNSINVDEGEHTHTHKHSIILQWILVISCVCICTFFFFFVVFLFQIHRVLFKVRNKLISLNKTCWRQNSNCR